jgi:hypothetical protein
VLAACCWWLPAACDEEGAFEAAPEEDIGTVCALHTDCIYGCTTGLRGSHSHCTRPCSAQEPCPAGYACVERTGLGPVCSIGECFGDGDCPADYFCFMDRNVCRHVDIPCTADEECAANVACNQGVCQLWCENDDDCQAGYHCQYDIGCVQCHYPADCPDHFACISGRCNTACIAENDCRPGYECNGAVCEVIVGGGSGQVGDSCDRHSDCADFCRGYQWCTRTCEGANDTTSCPDGWQCDPHQLYCVQA